MTPSTVFDSIESAQEYVALLCEALDEAAETIASEITSPVGAAHPRHMDALRLVDYKLRTLRQHFVSSRRLLNDLRTLRRYLFDERQAERQAAIENLHPATEPEFQIRQPVYGTVHGELS